MDSSIIITFAIPLFFGLILIEFFYGVITKQNNYRINDAITSMSLGLISRFVPILGLGFQYVVYKAVAEHYNFNLLNGEEIWVGLLLLCCMMFVIIGCIEFIMKLRYFGQLTLCIIMAKNSICLLH